MLFRVYQIEEHLHRARGIFDRLCTRGVLSTSNLCEDVWQLGFQEIINRSQHLVGIVLRRFENAVYFAPDEIREPPFFSETVSILNEH